MKYKIRRLQKLEEDIQFVRTLTRLPHFSKHPQAHHTKRRLSQAEDPEQTLDAREEAIQACSQLLQEKSPQTSFDV